MALWEKYMHLDGKKNRLDFYENFLNVNIFCDLTRIGIIFFLNIEKKSKNNKKIANLFLFFRL